MPIYEYHCNSCDKGFECLVFAGEEPECPSCNGSNIVRQMSACGFISKGSGGEPVKSSAAASSCSGCAATSCGSCGV